MTKRPHLKNLFALSLLCAASLTAWATPKTLQDVLGRNVEVDLPAKRVLLGFYFEDYMAVGGEKAFDNVIGISREAWEGWRSANWQLHIAHRPSLKDIPDVGEVEAQTFSIEKVLALKPEVVILADWQYKGLGSDIKRLEAAKIPVIVVDYNAQTLERHLASTKLLGEISGETGRAEKINTEYKSAIDQVQSRIVKANLPQPKVYVEFGNKGPAEYSFTYGKNMWGAMLKTAGGNNIAAPFVEWWGPMNPEQVLAAKPDVVFISGTESTKNPTAMQIGQGVDKSVAQQRLAGFAHRNGWAELPAIKNKRLYGVYQGASRTVSDFTMVQYMAKAIYPELFKDLQPEANYLSFYKRYLPVTPSGSFMVELGK